MELRVEAGSWGSAAVEEAAVEPFFGTAAAVAADWCWEASQSHHSSGET